LVSPTATTSYTVTETNINGCVSSNTVTITVNPLPAAVAGSNVSICTGKSTTIGGAAVNKSVYAWSPSTGLSASTVSNPVATPSATTTYNVTETDSNGCVATHSVKVTISVPAANPGPAQTVCSGTPTPLGATAVSGSTYFWVSNPSGFSSTSSNPTAAPISTTTYTVIETNSVGCFASNPVTITVNPLPAAAAGANSVVCSGSAATIGAAAVSGSTYAWVSTPSGFTSTASTATVNPTVTTSYKVTETNSNGCVNSNAVLISMGTPAAIAGVAKNICTGGSTTIGSTPPVAGSTYSWSPSASLSSSTVSFPTATPTVTTTYTVTETNSLGCTASNTVKVTIQVPAAAAGSPSTICQGQSTTVGGTSVSGSTYSWNPSAGLSSATSAKPTATPASTTTYTVTETTSAGCVGSNTVTVTVLPIPAAAVGSPATICAGVPDSIGAKAVVGDVYAWTSIPVGFTSNLAHPVVSPVVTTIYTLTETNPSGCSITNSVTITVSNPVAAAGSTKTICLGASATIGAAAVSGSTYTWSPTTGLSSSTLANPSASPTVTTIYTVTETNKFGCSASNSVTVNISIPAANAGSSVGICPGVLTLIGGAPVSGSTYSWASTPSGFTSTDAGPFVTPTTTTTYTVTEKNSNGCSASNSVTITVNPLPAASAGTSTAICKGSGAVVSLGAASVAGSSYIWAPSTGLSSATVSNPTAIINSTTTYTVTETNFNGCKASNSVTVTVNALPAANAGGSTKGVCTGSSATLGAAAVTGSTYSWSPSTGLSSTTAANPTVTPISGATYTVTEINAAGCTASNSIAVTVNPLPVPNAGTSQTVCSGTAATIGAGSVALNTYSWSPTTGLSSATVSNPVATLTSTTASTTTYTVTQTITATGCSAATTVSISINPLPAAVAGAAGTVCSAAPYTIGAAAVTGSTYSWAPSATLSSSTASSPVASPTSTTIYTVTETNSNGCVASNTVKVTISIPAAAVSPKTTCAGIAASIGATAVTGSTYSWSPATGLSSSTVSNPSATITSTATYTVTETNSLGCIASNPVTVTVNPLPVPVAGSAATICAGLSASLGTTTTSGNTYVWSPSTALSSSTVSNPTATPTTAGINTYTLTQTITATGCTASTTVNVTVLPAAAAAAGSNVSVCTGKTTTIGAAAVTGSTYTWSPSIALSSSTVANPVVTPTTTTTYTVTETTSGGCVASNSVTVTLNPAVASNIGSTTICKGQPTFIGAAAVTGSTYVWTSSPAGFNSALANPSVAPTTTTSYTVVETNVSGCTATNSLTLTISPSPAASVGANTTICPGVPTTIGSATADAGASYLWSSVPAGFTSTVSGPTVSPTITTIYSLTEISAFGCVTTNSVTVTVNTPIASTGPSTAFCAGGSVVIGSAAVSGNTYSWTPSVGLSSSTVSNPTASPTTTTAYTLTQTNATGCTTSGAITVTVNPLPTPTAGTPGTICSGTAYTIGNGIAVFGDTYSWAPATGLSSSTVSNPTASPVSTTTYTVTEKTTATGCSASASVTITTKPIPAAAAGTPGTVCSGVAYTIGAASVSGSTYTWAPSTNLSSTTVSSPVAKATSTTTYTVTETGTNGCSASNSVTVTVNTPVAAAGSAKSICSGSSTTIGATAVGGSTYAWTPSTGLSSTSASNPTASPTTTTTYTVTETNSTNCTNSNTVTVTVNPLPAVVAGSALTACSGSATTIGNGTFTTGDTYLWSPATGLSYSTSNNPTLTLGAAGVTTYTVTEKTTATGCSASTSVAITSLSLPAANAGSNATICSGSPYTIGAGSVSGSTYSWSPSAGLSSSTASNPVVTPASAGSYTYAVTETNGTCSNTNSVVITANPQPIAIAGASATVCSGTAYTLGTGTTSGNTYAWTPSTGLSSATVSNPTATPASATTYTLTQTITVTGCVATATVNVGVNALPAAAAGANASICSGASYTLGAGTLPVSGSTYSWSPSTSLSSSTVFNPVATPGSTTTYTVTETNSNNCVASNTIKVTINTPAAFAGAAQTVCAGSSVQIGTTAVGGSTYAWSPSTGLSSSTASNPTLAAASAGSFTYTVTETNSTSCTNSNSVVITVNPTPTPTAGAPGTVCAGTAFTIGTGTAVGGDTYSWSPSTGLSSSTVSGPVATPSSTTTYTVTEKTTATGCAASATVKVTALPAPAANAGAAAFICPGGSANIGAAPVTGDTYLWTPALGLTSNKASNPIATPSSTTTYTLTETNSIGCSASNSVTVKINIPAAATASPATICGGTPTSVGAATVVGSTYSWVSSPAGFTSTAGNPVAAPFVTTTYTVTEVNSTGCTNSNSVTITVNPAPAAAVGPPVTICNGSSASIGAAPVSGSTYSWTPSTGLSSATVSNPTVSASATTTYILTETNSLGCSAQHSVVVTVRVVAANAGSNASVCAGGSAAIGAASVSGSTYSWSPSTGLSSTAVSNPNATPLATTVYTVTETNGACSASHSVTVTVNSLPAAAAGSNTSVCLGNSATLGAALVSGSSYSWSPSAGLSSSVAAQPSATPTVTTTYSVTETNTAGCTASHSVTVTVNALPLAAAGSNAAVCPGGSTVIGSTAVAGSTYTWSPATGLSSSTASNPTATPASTTTYTVTEKNTSNCTASNSVTVTVNTLPVAATGPAQTIWRDRQPRLGLQQLPEALMHG